MGRQIIQQPNGKFCLFSSVVDNIVAYDLDRDGLVEEAVAVARRRVEDEIDGILCELATGNKPYFQFTMTYPEMLATIEELHGDQERQKVVSRIEGSDAETAKA